MPHLRSMSRTARCAIVSAALVSAVGAALSGCSAPDAATEGAASSSPSAPQSTPAMPMRLQRVRPRPRRRPPVVSTRKPSMPPAMRPYPPTSGADRHLSRRGRSPLTRSASPRRTPTRLRARTAIRRRSMSTSSTSATVSCRSRRCASRRAIRPHPASNTFGHLSDGESSRRISSAGHGGTSGSTPT